MYNVVGKTYVEVVPRKEMLVLKGKQLWGEGILDRGIEQGQKGARLRVHT